MRWRRRPSSSFDSAAINQPDHPELSRGAKGSPAVRAQILLSRAHFSVGEIDGSFGSNMAKALAAYQAERKLPASGMVDTATWAALNADTAPALVEYTATAEDVTGPYRTLPKDIKEQAKLKSLGYDSWLEALGERVRASPALLKALNPAATFDRAEEKLLLPNATTMPPGRAARIEGTTRTRNRPASHGRSPMRSPCRSVGPTAISASTGSSSASAVSLRSTEPIRRSCYGRARQRGATRPARLAFSKLETSERSRGPSAGRRTR